MRFWVRRGIEAMRSPRKLWMTLRNYARTNDVEVFVVSFPKTGRTWLRVMLGKVLSETYTLPGDSLLDIYSLTKIAGIKRAMFTHDGPLHLMSSLPYYQLTFNNNRYKQVHVVFIVRDIRDTIVSSYFQETKRANTFQGSIGEFIRDDIFGIRKLIAFYNIWFENTHVPKTFTLVRYEDMKRDASSELNKVLNVLGADKADDAAVRTAVEFATFDNMRKMELEGRFKDAMMKPGKVTGDPKTLKTRRGQIGSFVEHLLDEDIKYIHDELERMKIAECQWYINSK